MWAAPWTLVGLVLALFFKHRRVVEGVLVCEGARWPGRFGWSYRAITFGHVVLAVDRLDPETLAHELVHVAQYERWGPAFVPAYLWSSLLARARGGHHYLDNGFEVAARDGSRPIT